ncbi:MAG: lipoyl(octanoyl) transferase LipB [Bacteroidetes bacterium]|nr:lipoyl(octanoyl) transferase LipB [Bacteroidota bacterium]
MSGIKNKIIFRDLGLVDYKKTWDYQESLLNLIVTNKLSNRLLNPDEQIPSKHYLLFCEHPHVFTLGKSGNPDHLLLDENQLQENNAVFYKINRGGDITYHGPGQVVGYPIFDLDCFFNDIHLYLRYLEEAVIRMLNEYGIISSRIDKLTGVWIDAENPAKARKICAFGVRCSRWVTMHGFALNVNTNLDYFNHIIPCGINDKMVTSMHFELGYEVNIFEVKESLKKHLCSLFNIELFEEKAPQLT